MLQNFSRVVILGLLMFFSARTFASDCSDELVKGRKPNDQYFFEAADEVTRRPILEAFTDFSLTTSTPTHINEREIDALYTRIEVEATRHAKTSEFIQDMIGLSRELIFLRDSGKLPISEPTNTLIAYARSVVVVSAAYELMQYVNSSDQQFMIAYASMVISHRAAPADWQLSIGKDRSASEYLAQLSMPERTNLIYNELHELRAHLAIELEAQKFIHESLKPYVLRCFAGFVIEPKLHYIEADQFSLVLLMSQFIASLYRPHRLQQPEYANLLASFKNEIQKLREVSISHDAETLDQTLRLFANDTLMTAEGPDQHYEKEIRYSAEHLANQIQQGPKVPWNTWLVLLLRR